jgi:uncharacterized protein (TIGR02266 family)
MNVTIEPHSAAFGARCLSLGDGTAPAMAPSMSTKAATQTSVSFDRPTPGYPQPVAKLAGRRHATMDDRAIHEINTAPPHRQHPRARLSVEVSMSSEHTFHTGLAENISEGGLFVVTHIPPPLGEIVHIFIELGSPRARAALNLTGQVQWIRIPSREGLPPGCGLKFLSVSEEALAVLRDFIAKRV